MAARIEVNSDENDLRLGRALPEHLSV